MKIIFWALFLVLFATNSFADGRNVSVEKQTLAEIYSFGRKLEACNGQYQNEIELCKKTKLTNEELYNKCYSFAATEKYIKMNKKIKECYTNIYHQLTEKFYNKNKDILNSDYNKLVDATETFYINSYSLADFCKNDCGSAVYLQSYQATNDKIKDFIINSLMTLEYYYKN